MADNERETMQNDARERLAARRARLASAAPNANAGKGPAAASRQPSAAGQAGRAGAQRPGGSLLDAAGKARVRTEVNNRNADGSVVETVKRVQPQREQGTPLTLVDFAKSNWKYIAAVVVVAVLVAGLVSVLRGCAGQSGTAGTDASSSAAAKQAYVSPYDWSKVQRGNGRMAYVVDGRTLSRQGIDVSENQHWIDWDAVAADGIDFAMIRLGYRGTTAGDLYLDEYFDYNLAGAQAAGIDVGIYFFSQAIDEDEAREEAEYVLEHLNGATLQYPIAFDSEEVALGVDGPRTAGLSVDQMNAIQEAFCQRIEQAGYRSMVYGNARDMSRYRRASLEQTELWWAEYNAPSPAATIDIVMWQYANNGQVAGIETDVDMDIDLSGAL